MSVNFILFICALALLMSWRRRNEEIREPRGKERKPRDLLIERPQPVRESERIRKVIGKQPVIKIQQPPKNSPPPPKSTKGKRFVQVKFKESSRKCYDYLIGDVRGLKVGDVVLVPIHKSKERLDKEIRRMIIEMELTGKPGEMPRKTTCLRAKIMRISKPGEVSQYARSVIIKKLN